MINSMKEQKMAFFGTPGRAVVVLNELKKAGILPELIITQPDRPQGRKMMLAPTPVKVWAEQNHIPFIQPDSLNDTSLIEDLRRQQFDVFVVVAYGKIFKKGILNIPKHGCINLHASLLPKLRGSSPIESAILEDEKETGLSIILMDEKMDHGPIISQKKTDLPKWPMPADDLADIICKEGGKLLADTLPLWINGDIEAKPQDHSKATYTNKISKQDGLIDLEDEDYKNFLKWNAHKGWPSSYFFINKEGKELRVIISDATYEDGKFIIKSVVPEGRSEIPWQTFVRNFLEKGYIIKKANQDNR